MFNWNTPKPIQDEKKIDALLERGVEAIFPSKEFLKAKLMKGERVTLYLGIDPTGPTLHLGHLIPLRKLAEFQKLGHQIILLIGDFTATIGDPTDKLATRVPLTREQVLKNAELYKEQASKIISFSGNNKALIKYNSKWLSHMPMEEIFKLMSHITYAQTIKRDMFQQRIAQGKDLSLHEFMYPIMQGYDSVAMDVDGEVGGNDQTFNMLVGRDLLKKMKNKEKFVVASKLLVDPSGKKMGKTEGNIVSLDQTPEDMFGKVMSWSDELIVPGFEIITDASLEEITTIKDALARGDNPRDLKVRLAHAVVSMLHGKEEADNAKESFESTFSKGEVPEDIQEIKADKDSLLRDAIVGGKIVDSNGEWRRLVESKAVSFADTKESITDPFVKIERDCIVRVGKKRFAKISVR
ncbi:MAG: tyrosine--tRNA ligase [Patescibacteria group bacterium]